MKIQILGPGCPKCKRVLENAKRAIEELAVIADVEKVQDLKAIMGFQVMVTPALAIDGEVKVSGRIPSVDEIKRLIGQKTESGT